MKSYASLLLRGHFKYLLIWCLSISSLSAQTIRYVKDNGTGNGSSWGRASNSLQSMIDISSPGDEVWVAQGSYQPAPGQSFSMKEGVKIYGGFPAEGSPGWDQRNWRRYTTILRGNGYRVITNQHNGTTRSALLDGFEIINGISDAGGGGIANINASPSFQNLVVTGNQALHGGGIYMESSSSWLTNVTISGNNAQKFGGGIHILYPASSVLTNMAITGNQAQSGGGVYISQSDPVLTNATIAGNTATLFGGGLFNENSTQAKIRNSIISGNSSDFFVNTSTSLHISHSLIGYNQGYGAVTGSDNLVAADPLFVDQQTPGLSSQGNYRLKPGSPAINQGNVDYFDGDITPDLSAVETDLDGNSRFLGASIDMGAYERDVVTVAIRYVRQGATGTGLNWDDASGDLQSTINASSVGGQVWVAAGTYQPISGESFAMKDGVKIYGGFPAEGTPTIAQRNWATHLTILRQGEDETGSVLSNYKIGNTALLDGFTITGAETTEGGGVYNNESSPTLANLIITGNKASSGGGGIFNVHYSSPTIVNVVMHGNTGGGIFNSNGSSPIVINSTMADPVYSESQCLPSYKNSIIWAETTDVSESYSTYHYCIIKNIRADAENHNPDGTRNPMFVDAPNGNYALKSTSYAINMGNNDYFASGQNPDVSSITNDILGNPRIQHTLVDIGAYEYSGEFSIRYVAQDSTGNGTSWANASGNLQAMIDQSFTGNQVWVATGEYQPAAGESFQMKEGIKIYGGYHTEAGTSRDWRGRPTVLKGNGNSVIINSNNGLTSAAVLDGFYIKGGSEAIAGGGICNLNASPTLKNLFIQDNQALLGGGISNEYASPVITNVFIQGNSTLNTTGGNGGGIYNYQSAPAITNVLISGNHAHTGGGIYNATATPVLTNVTIAANFDINSEGGAVYNSNLSKPAFRNTLISRNSHGLNDQSGSVSTVLYSLVQGRNADAGNHNLEGSSNPLFVRDETPGLSTGGDYSLQPRSPVVNMGSGEYYIPGKSPDLSDIETDLDENYRIQGAAIDIGAHEVVLELVPVTPRYVKQGGTGNGYSWENASGNLQAMINESSSGEEVWVAAGTYQPASGQSFSMKEGVKILGGFPAEGTPTIADRDWVAHATLLKGNHNSTIANNQNNLTSAAVLDGFTITGGSNATGGGAAYNHSASPTLVNLVIKDNTSSGKGGAIWNYNASPTIKNTLITANTASYGAAGFNEQGSQPVFINCTITANRAYNGACGGVNTGGANTVAHFKNSIVYNNTFNDAIDLTSNIRNEVGGSSGYSYSLIQGSGGSTHWNEGFGIDAGNNVDGNPYFVDADAADYTLLPVSPAINNGNAQAFENAATQKDLAGSTRVYAMQIDIGAYEYHGAIVPTNNRLYVRKGSSGTGSSWDDALGELADALKFAKEYDAYWSGENTFQVWADGGTYKPLYSPDDDNFGNPDGRHNAFRLIDDVQVYGGFAGIESTLQERDLSLTANASILSGDFNDDDLITETDQIPTTFSHTEENAYHVVVAAGSNSAHLSSNAILDGFTISGGNAQILGDGATVSGNKISMASGGGIYNVYSDMMMLNLVVRHNAGSNGGGVYNLQSSPKIAQVLLTQNYGNWGGGVLNFQSSPEIKNSRIKYNAYYIHGGGIYNYQSSPLIDSVQIIGNRPSASITTSTGGGIHNRESPNVRLINVIIENNVTYSGGAIYNDNSSATVSHSILRGNVAYYNGGGAYITTRSGLEIVGSQVTGNYADSWGGGLYIGYESNGAIINSSFSGNYARVFGGGISAGGRSAIIQNSIVFGNNTGIHGAASVKNSNIQGGYSTENGNISEDPLFTEAPSYSLAPFSSGDYTLQACSPVINLGNNSWIPANLERDLAGNPRVYDETVDMGAYESQSTLAIGAGGLALDGNSATVSIAADELEVKTNDAPCRTITTIVPTGDAPVSGNVTATVYIDQTVQFHTGSPYVQRYYDIAPANGVQTATARITLYFTQDEFDSFNDELSSGTLPTSSEDISGKSNLRVFQFHGSSESGRSPSSYTGSLTTIDPSDEDIVWNQTLERWEVSFGVTGFSGFFVGSASSPLPVKLVTFQIFRTDAETVELQWDVTEQVDIARYEVQYSPNGRNFTIIGNVAATDSEQTSYRFTDTFRAGPVAYYRLQIVEQDGSEELSRIVSIALPHTNEVTVYPVPARDYVWVEGVGLSGTEIKIVDLQGRVLKAIYMQSDLESMEVSDLQPGVYIINIGKGVTKKFLKQ